MPLGVEQRGVSALAGRELLDVVAHQALEQLGVVAAFHSKLAAKGKIEKPGSSANGAVLRSRIGESRRNHGAVIFRQRRALGNVIIVKWREH